MFKRYCILALISFFFLSPVNTSGPIVLSHSPESVIVLQTVDQTAKKESLEQSDQNLLDSSSAPLLFFTQETEAKEINKEVLDQQVLAAQANVETDIETLANLTLQDLAQDAVQNIIDEIEEVIAAAKPALIPEPKKSIVTVFVDIPQEHQKYKHWTGFSYQPKEFYCTVNGIKVLPENTIETPLTDNKLDITYYSCFENGRESSKKYTYSLKTDTNKVTVQFDWKRKVRIFLLDDEAALFESFEEII